MARILFVALFISSSIAIISTVLYAICKNTSSVSLSSSNETCSFLNNVTAPSNWTGPDWASFPTTNETLSLVPGPEPIPRSITDPAVIQLVTNAQEQLLIQYDALGTIACLAQGNTINCQGPWLNGADWNNQTLSLNVVQNTVTIPSFECSSNQAYESVNKQVFYGFTANNITDSLQGIAHSASMFAAGACIFNSSCATSYNNNTSQMYYDFRNYVNSTFFDSLATSLSQNESLTFCPKTISSPASIFSIPTTSFDGGKEYFGLHDAIFLPNVAQSINGTLEEAKKELKALLGNNGLKSEGVFLNMIFFNYGSLLGLNKRFVDDEVYPGCKRKTWIVEGYCNGVIPPRDFDLAGSVVPMSQRDRFQTIAELSGKSNTNLTTRGSQCDSIKGSISNSIENFEAMKTELTGADGVLLFLQNLGGFVDEVAVGTVTGVASSGAGAIGATILAGLTLGFFMAMASCGAFNDCDGFPPTLVSFTESVMGPLHTLEGSGILHEIIENNEGKVAASISEALQSVKGLTFGALNSVEGYTNALLEAAINSYTGALTCCGNDCMAAVCQQASTGCLLETGSYWSFPSGGQNCAAK